VFASGMHDLTIATLVAAQQPGDSSLNKQLIYTPRIKHLLSAGIGYMGFTLTYYHHYTGIRFASSDNQSWLPAYHYAKLSLGKRVQLKSTTLQLQAIVNNLFNTTYQVIVSRPMPLRNYQLSVSYKF
jgi:iron complex outermembrane receptor protein